MTRDDHARRAAELLKELVRDTKVATSGCTVCGEKGHNAGAHDSKRKG